MKKIFLPLLLLVSSVATAADCVKVRDECLAFTETQHQAARQRGLAMGMRYVEVRERIVAQRWAEKGDKGKMTCGGGVDATCSQTYLRDHHSLSLIFSAVNNGLPLVAVALDDD